MITLKEGKVPGIQQILSWMIPNKLGEIESYKSSGKNLWKKVIRNMKCYIQSNVRQHTIEAPAHLYLLQHNSQ
jgi:hypothetical protein